MQGVLARPRLLSQIGTSDGCIKERSTRIILRMTKDATMRLSRSTFGYDNYKTMVTTQLGNTDKMHAHMRLSW